MAGGSDTGRGRGDNAERVDTDLNPWPMSHIKNRDTQGEQTNDKISILAAGFPAHS